MEFAGLEAIDGLKVIKATVTLAAMIIMTARITAIFAGPNF